MDRHHSDEDRKLLQTIWEAIQRIQYYHLRGVEYFEESDLLQGWIAQNLRILAEAARALSPELKAQRREVPWEKFARLATTLTHEWSRVEGAVILTVIERDLPDLRRHVEEALIDLSHVGRGPEPRPQ